MGVLGTIRSIFSGLTDQDTETETAADAVSADAAPAEVSDAVADVVDADGNGLDDSVDEEMAINAVNADIEAEREKATDKLLNYPGME